MQLNKAEREWIEFWFRLGRSRRWIGKFLNRDHSVIVRELGRNKMIHSPYQANFAQLLTQRREQAKHQSKLVRNWQLRNWIIKCLKQAWSPEQIAGRLKSNPPPHLKGKTVCHETVYQAIYRNEDEFFGSWRQLRRHRSKRRLRGKRRSKSILIANRTSIHHRPEVDSDFNFTS